jgi:hypothetical protein
MKTDRCPVCGAVAPLRAVHVLQKRPGVPRDKHDLVYMCPSCHHQMDQHSLREFEFEVVLADLMNASDAYSGVQLQGSLDAKDGHRAQPDIVAKDARSSATVVVECRGFQAMATPRLRDAIAQLKAYDGDAESRRLVLAMPARLTRDQKNMAAGDGVEIWDLDEIAVRFRDHIEMVTHPTLRPLLLAVAALVAPGAAASVEAALLDELQQIIPGQGSWRTYQKVVSRILERLFCPPLSSPLLELSDEDRINRRDIVLPNYAESGFWLFVRQRYAADFVVVDAKNYSNLVGKQEALQVLNYLKVHGAGMLGMIVTRHGADPACIATIREQWTIGGKLLVVLSDDHLSQMLRVREAGGPPDDVVRQCIEEFRLSM